jgi:hypothetical protein
MKTALCLPMAAMLCAGCGLLDPSDEITCDRGLNTRHECPGSPATSRATALQTLEAVEGSLRAQFPNAVWLGGIAGLGIDREGRGMDQGPMVDLGGITMEDPTGWTGNFCNDDGPVPQDQLNFDTTKGQCTVLRNCEVYDCSAAPRYARPAVDSPAAIQAAFPDDPPGTLYGLELVLAVGNYWTVTRTPADGSQPVSVKIDAASGAVIAP